MDHTNSQISVNATACPGSDAPSALPVARVISKQAGTLNTRKPLNIASWNVRTLLDPGAQSITMRSLNDYNVSICCLSETRIPGSGSKPIKIPGKDCTYTLYHSGPCDGSGLHGVAIAVNPVANKALLSWEPVSPRIAVARFRGNPVGITVVCVYAPTLPAETQVKDAFYEELQRVVDSTSKREILILAGDWNARTGKADDNTRHVIGKFGIGQRCDNGERLLNFASQNRLVVASTKFQHPRKHLLTWYSNDGRTASQIDHVLIRSRWMNSMEDCRAYRGAETGNANGSDHVLVRAKFRLHLRARPNSHRVRRIDVAALECVERRQALTDSLDAQLSTEHSDDTNQASTVNDQWEKLKLTLQDACLSHLGTTTKKPKDWLSAETLLLSDQAKAARLAGLPSFRQLRRQATRSARADRARYWAHMAEEMEEASRLGNLGELFRLIRSSSGHKHSGEHALQDSSGQLIYDAEKKIARWAEYFSTLLNHPSVNSEELTTVDCEPYVVGCDPPSVDEIRKAITQLRNRKAPGEDGIPAEVFKACMPALIRPLHRLFEEIWEKEAVPSDWGLSILLPIPKKGDRTVCQNYRGISLIDIAAKIFAIILLARFSQARDARTRPNQCGFRPGKGCVDQIFTLRRVLEHRFKFQQPTTACFIDFQAAFDSVDRESLWKIAAADGMPNKLLNLIKAYYGCTRGSVRSQGLESDAFLIRSGVRQGCPLSPVLFNYAIDWVMENSIGNSIGIKLSPTFALSDLEYADDIVVLSDDPSNLQPLLDSVASHASMVGLKVNTRKTKYFTTALGPHLPLTVEGTCLEQVSAFRYLGSNMLPTGQAKDEIPVRIASARSAFYRLNSSLFKRTEISLRTKVRVYRAAVRPVLTYGCETWPLRVEDLERLEVFDHWCLRRILRVRRVERISNQIVRQRCQNIPRLRSVLRSHRLRWFGHVLRRPPSDLTRATLCPTPVQGWRCRPGGQLKTWLSTIKEDVELFGLRNVYGTRQWTRNWLDICADFASDRRAWNAAIRDSNEADSSPGGS